MCRIYLDNCELNVAFKNCQTIADVIDTVKNDYLNGRIRIEKVYVDNKSFYDSDSGSLDLPLSEETRLERAHQIRIFTNSSFQIAREAVVGVMLYVEDLADHLMKISSSLRAGNSSEIFTVYSCTLEGMYWITELIAGLEKMFPVGYESEVLKAFSIRSFVESVSEQLKQLAQAQEGNNSTLLADILENKIIQSFLRWKIVLAQIEQELAGEDRSGEDLAS